VFGTTYSATSKLGIATQTRDGLLGYVKGVKPAAIEIQNVQARGLAPQFPAAIDSLTGGSAALSRYAEIDRLKSLSTEELTGASLATRNAKISLQINTLQTRLCQKKLWRKLRELA
jgi:hypothetical protein